MVSMQKPQDVPKGYKLTEIGVIPSDWECRMLGEFSDVVRGGSPRPAGDPKYFKGSYIPWLTVASLTNIPVSQLYVRVTATMLTKAGSLRSRILESGTLIISNSGATLGVAKILGIKCCANDGVAALINQRSCNKEFLAQYINTKTKVLHDDVATGNGQPNLNTDLIKSILVPYPLEREQTAIANVLSDVDSLINQLEKLITKKRAIKTSAMQQLLTGKKRLPPFDKVHTGFKQTELGEIPEDWEVVVLGEFSDITKLAGFEYSNYFNGYRGGGKIIVMRGTNITHNKLDLSDVKTIPEAVSRMLPRSRLFKGDLVFAYVGTIGPVYIVKEDDRFHLGPNTAKITCKKNVDNEFLFVYFKSTLIRSEIEEKISVGAQPSLSMTKIRSFKVILPSLKEQWFIAKTISEIEYDLEALEDRLNKVKQIKQGMMQELLTGKTRLVAGEL